MKSNVLLYIMIIITDRLIRSNEGAMKNKKRPLLNNKQAKGENKTSCKVFFFCEKNMASECVCVSTDMSIRVIVCVRWRWR